MLGYRTGRSRCSGNKLTVLPRSIGDLRALKSLKVSDNELTELPSSIGQLGALRELYLAETVNSAESHLYYSTHANKLTHLPPSICNLSLTKLYAGHNCLAELPEGIARMDSLKTLWIENNCLKSLPDALNEGILVEGYSIRQDKTTKEAVLATQRPSADYSVKQKIWVRVKALL